MYEDKYRVFFTTFTIFEETESQECDLRNKHTLTIRHILLKPEKIEARTITL